jgi:hypothetical protein
MAIDGDLRLTDYFMGLDLGQASDYSALVIAVRSAGATLDQPCAYDVRHIERFPLGTRYPAVVDRVELLTRAIGAQHTLRRPPINQNAEPDWKARLAVDFTGVGRGVVDFMATRSLDAQLVPITITGGDAVSEVGPNEYRVPKRDLAGVVQVLLQLGRLRIAKDLPLTALLTEELINFKAKISLTGHDSYGAGEDWRAGNHDDLVLALAMAVWLGERERTKQRGMGGGSLSYLKHPLQDQALAEGWRWYPDGTPVEEMFVPGFHNKHRSW